MRIRSIEKADREFFIDRCPAFYRTSACDHEIPQQNAERTFELLMHGTPYADCLIAEDDDGTPCAYCLLALTWSNEAGGLCVWLDELMVDDEQRGKGIGSRMIAAMADASYAKSLIHVERYEEGVLSASRALLNQYDKNIASAEESQRAALREEANTAIAAELKKRASDTLDKVLFELSSGMKNAYARSDA